MNASVSSTREWNLQRLDWNRLDQHERLAALSRPTPPEGVERTRKVADIIAAVQSGGDDALRRLTAELDGCELDDFRVSEQEFAAAAAVLPQALKDAMAEARERIMIFHAACMQQPSTIETAPGVVCERQPRPIGRVGLYVPAGSAPLPSTALMLGVPASLAGCRHIVLCTPPRKDGTADASVLYAAQLCGITQVFKLGGAQAIAAMAEGTASVPACDKLFGPGNSWVTEAKCQVTAKTGGPAIDMPAGPSEILVIADAAANPEFVAADLLSQAEHGPDSQVILLSDSDALLDKVAPAVATQLAALPRANIATQALRHSRMIKVDSIAQAIRVSNAYAPEHLIVNTDNPRQWLDQIHNAGSVFLGAWAPESMGDYCSGTNHVLPTYGHARAWSGLSVESFRKHITVQELSAEGLANIGACAHTLASAEGLDAHARAVAIRFKAMGKPLA